MQVVKGKLKWIKELCRIDAFVTVAVNLVNLVISAWNEIHHSDVSMQQVVSVAASLF